MIHVVSVSGGKDSAAVCLHLRELGIAHELAGLERIVGERAWERHVASGRGRTVHASIPIRTRNASGGSLAIPVDVV